MTQAQTQQIPQYTAQYRRFDEMVQRLHPVLAADAYAVCATKGLEEGINFCWRSLKSDEKMQAIVDARNL
jgi:hypothetical protein